MAGYYFNDSGFEIAFKLSQCAEGEINILVLGVPNPMFDLDVSNALYGTSAITLEHLPHAQGVPPLGDPQQIRVPGGIFRLASESVADLPEDEKQIAADYIKLYRDISGVLRIRVGASQPRADYLPNHNAEKQLSSERVARLVEVARQRVNRRSVIADR